MAQVELFFTQAVATAPLTVCLIAKYSERPLVSVFYDSIGTLGELLRSQVDPTDVDLPRNFRSIAPYLGKMITGLTSQFQKLARAVLAYEKARLYAAYGDKSTCKGLRFFHAFCSTFECGFDVNSLVAALRDDSGLSDTINNRCSVLYVRRDFHKLDAFWTAEPNESYA